MIRIHRMMMVYLSHLHITLIIWACLTNTKLRRRWGRLFARERESSYQSHIYECTSISYRLLACHTFRPFTQFQFAFMSAIQLGTRFSAANERRFAAGYCQTMFKFFWIGRKKKVIWKSKQLWWSRTVVLSSKWKFVFCKRFDVLLKTSWQGIYNEKTLW